MLIRFPGNGLIRKPLRPGVSLYKKEEGRMKGRKEMDSGHCALPVVSVGGSGRSELDLEVG